MFNRHGNVSCAICFVFRNLREKEREREREKERERERERESERERPVVKMINFKQKRL